MAEIINIKNGGYTLAGNLVKHLIEKGIEKSVPPSLFICQLYYESNWGNSNVAVLNNNWGGLTWSGNPIRPSGIIVERGTARPSDEGGYYMKFKTVEDYLTDYVYLITDQGIYNIQNKSSFSESVKGLFIVGGAKYDYAAVGASAYIDTMNGIRNGINSRNNDFLTNIDTNPNDYVDAPVPDPPEGDADGDWGGVDLQGLFKQVTKLIDEMLSKDVYQSGTSKFYSNAYLQLMNQMENTYKVNANKPFFDKLEKEFKDFNDHYLPDPDPDQDPDPDPPATGEWIFPVKLGGGINFWKRSNWGVGTLQRNMTYGIRSGGKFHAGYDIGGGGSNHPVFALADCIITDIRWVTGGGYSIFMDHINDDYHSLYLHLVDGSATVKKGDTVSAGQRIATMGKTGGNYAIHLHVELSKTGAFHNEANTVDPEPLLKITDDNKTGLTLPN